MPAASICSRKASLFNCSAILYKASSRLKEPFSFSRSITLAVTHFSKGLPSFKDSKIRSTLSCTSDFLSSST